MSLSGWMKVLLLVLLAHGILHCGNSTPTSPTRFPGTGSSGTSAVADGQTQTAGNSLKGRLTNAVSGEPIRGAHSELPGVASGRTRGDGTFDLSLPAAGEFPLIVEAEGCFRRETRVLAQAGREGCRSC